MKIISKFKDYYDYLQGIYGIDEKIVYERKNNTIFRPTYLIIDNYTEIECYTLAICGIIYVVHIYNGKFYFGGDITLILKNIKKPNKWDEIGRWEFNKKEIEVGYIKHHLKKIKINDSENCPVCLLRNSNSYRPEWEVKVNNVKLSDFGLQQIISPHDMYITISNFLSREKPVEDNRTNKEKIIGHGFDNKKSFRNM